MLLLFRALERTTSLPIVHLDDMIVCYTTAFQRLSVLGVDDSGFNISFTEPTRGADLVTDELPPKSNFSELSMGLPNTVPLRHTTMQAFTSNPLDLLGLATRFYDFLKFQAKLHSEIQALIYCLHRIKAWSSSSVVQTSNDSFHKQARDYLGTYLTTSLQSINAMLRECPLLTDAYLSKMVCISLLRQLELPDSIVWNDILEELLGVANSGIENCGVLLILYDQVDYRSTGLDGSHSGSHLIYLTNTMKSLIHGLLLGWYTLRGYRVNLLRQLGRLDDACAEARELIKLTTTSMQGEKRRDGSFCTCVFDTHSLKPLDLSTNRAEPLDSIMLAAQQTNFIPVHSKACNGFVQFSPPFHFEPDSSTSSFSSQNAIASTQTIKLLSLRDIYTSSSFVSNPLLESDSHSESTNASIIHLQTSPFDKQHALQKAQVQSTSAKAEDLESRYRALSDTGSTGCPVHSVSSKHVDYRLIYLLTILEAGHDDEAFEYLISGVFRSNLFSRLRANLDHGTVTAPGKIAYSRFEVQNSGGYHYHAVGVPTDFSSAHCPIYYRHHSEGISCCQHLGDHSQECVDDYFDITTKPSSSSSVHSSALQDVHTHYKKRRPHSVQPCPVSRNSKDCNCFTTHSFLAQHNRLLTSILYQRAYKHINHILTSKHGSFRNNRTLTKLSLGRLKPSTHFINSIKMSFDPKLLMIIDSYFLGQIRGPLSRILFYGPYYHFKCIGDKPHASLDDVQDVLDIASSSSHSPELLQSQSIWFNYHAQSNQSGITTTVSYSTIDSPASTFLCIPETKTAKSILHTTPLTTVTATYTLLLLILKRRATWANKLAHSIFAERMLGCDCALSSMLLEKSMNVMDLSMAWPKKCLRLKIIPSMLLTDVGVRPAIPSTKLLHLAFSTNPYVVEHLLAKAVLPSKVALHGLTLLFDISMCTDPDYLLAAQYPEESLQFAAYRQSMRAWQDRYCKQSEERQSISATDAKSASQTDPKDKELRKNAAMLRLSERRKALFQLAQDQRRLEAAVYVSEFGGLWGSDALYLQIHTLAEKLAIDSGTMAGIPFSFYIRSLRVITLGLADECEGRALHKEDLQLSSHGYLHIAALDFLLQAYIQYLQFEASSALKSLVLHNSIVTNSCVADTTDNTELVDIKDIKDTINALTDTNGLLKESFYRKWKAMWRATLLQFKGYPSYLFLRSTQAMKELFYHLIFSHRHLPTPDRPGMLSYVNPLLCLLNTNAQFQDVMSLVPMVPSDKTGLLQLLQGYLTAFMSGPRKELFSVPCIESQQISIYFDMPILAVLFSLTIVSTLELKSSFAPGSILLELNRLTTFSTAADTAASTSLLVHSANDLSHYYISPMNKTKKHVSLTILNCMTFGMLSKKNDTEEAREANNDSASPNTAAFIANRDAYKALQESTRDTLSTWINTKVLPTIKSSSSSMQSMPNAQYDVRAKRKPARHAKSSNYQHRRLPPQRAQELQQSLNIDDVLLSSFHIDDDNDVYKSFLRNPGLCLRLSRLQRTQYFGLTTLRITLEIEDIIERMLVSVNYSISDLILIYLLAKASDYANEELNMSYIYDSDVNLDYQCPASPFGSATVPLIYYLVEKGQDEVLMLLMERVISALSYRDYLSNMKEPSVVSASLASPEDFCGYSLSLADDVLIELDHDDDTILPEGDASSPLLVYLAARRKARLGLSSSLDIDAFITPSMSSFGGTHKLATYEAQAKVLDIPLSKAEIDALYTAKAISKQEVEICMNPLWVNTVGSTKLLRSSVDSLVHCCYKGETLLHAASKRDHLQIIELILLLFPLNCYDLLRSFYAILLNHSSNALRLFIVSPLHSFLDSTRDVTGDVKDLTPTADTDNPECKRLLQSSITAAYGLSDMPNILSNSFSYDFNPLIKLSLSESLPSSLTNHGSLADKLKDFQELISSNHYYSFLSWAHLIRTLQPFCSGTMGGVSCLTCYYAKTNTCKKSTLFKYLSFAKTPSFTGDKQDKRYQPSTMQKLLAQQCYFSGNSLHGCIGLLLSAKIDMRICTIQSMKIYNVVGAFSRTFVMEHLPIKTPEQRTELSYPDPIILLKHLPHVYQALSARRLQNNSNLNSMIFDRFCTPLSTPLIMAAQYGSPVCHVLCAIITSVTASTTADDLLSNPTTLKAYINHRDAYGLTALHHATILFIRAFISVIKSNILPIISLGLSVTAPYPPLYKPETIIFDNEFACSILASSRANIKALILAGADPEIPDATGVRCCDRLIAMLLEMNMILFPPEYAVTRFHEDQPTDILMQLIAWSETHHKPSRGDATLNPDSSLTIRMPILVEAKHVNWREELVRIYIKQLQDSGHIKRDALPEDGACSHLALNLRVQLTIDTHPKISSVSSAMQVIIQSNCTRVISELSIVLSVFLGLPSYQDRSQAFIGDTVLSPSPQFTPAPAEIVPLPFCGVTADGIQQYLDLWLPTSQYEVEGRPPPSSSIPMQELLLWGYSLYSVYGLRECRLIDEFHAKWSVVDNTFLPWDPHMYHLNTPIDGGVTFSSTTLPAADQLPPLLHSLSLESATSRLTLGDSRIVYRKTRDCHSSCQYVSTSRLRNHVWRRISARALTSSCSSDDGNAVHHIDISNTGSAIVDAITMSMSHTLLQSSLLEFPNWKLSNIDILALLKESLVICFHEEEACIASNGLESPCASITYRDVLCLSNPADDSILLALRAVFRRARVLSILADSVCPRSTLLFCSPDDLCFPSAWTLSQCFVEQKLLVDLSETRGCDDHPTGSTDELYMSIALLDITSNKAPRPTEAGLSDKVCSADTRNKKLALFTPNRLGFVRLQSKQN